MNSSETTKQNLKDPEFRYDLCRKSLKWFSICYLPHYLSYNFAPFHNEIFEALEDENGQRVSILGFRESAKSAIVNTVYVLWCICYGKRQFIVSGSEEITLAVSQTTSVAYELLFNELIHQDFGRLYYDENEGQVKARKRSVSDFTTKNGIRVKAVSAGSKVRGLRHNQSRPDLFILDDMDSLKSVVNPLIRDARYNWFKAEVLPGMNQAYGKCIVLGNMIHYDCFMAKVQKETEGWIHLSIPVYDGAMYEGEIAWKKKYVWTEAEATQKNKALPKEKKVIAIESIKKDKGSRVFGQEYLLVPATDEDRIFKRKFIEGCLDFERTFIPERLIGVWSLVTAGNDLAISERESSDYFVIVTLGIEKEGDKNKLILMNIYRDKNLTPEQQRQAVKTEYAKYQQERILIEDNAYQAFFVKDMADTTRLPVKGFRTGLNKRDEIIGLNAMAVMFENGKFVLPYGDEKTIRMVDALIEEMIQYPDGHSGDILMAFWFAWNAMKEFENRTQVNISIDKGGLYAR